MRRAVRAPSESFDAAASAAVARAEAGSAAKKVSKQWSCRPLGLPKGPSILPYLIGASGCRILRGQGEDKAKINRHHTDHAHAHAARARRPRIAPPQPPAR